MTKKKIEVFVSEDIKNKLKSQARDKGITLSELIKRIFENHLQ